MAHSHLYNIYFLLETNKLQIKQIYTLLDFLLEPYIKKASCKFIVIIPVRKPLPKRVFVKSGLFRWVT